MVSLLRTPYMVYRNVIDDFMHGGEDFIAGILGFWLVFVYPQTGVLLF
jgi:hypothetical protein